MSSGITFSGLGSGIDVNSIVGQLVNLERRPIQRLEQQKAQLGARQEVLSQFRSRVVQFNTALSSLQMPSAYNTIKATSSDASVASISGESANVEGSYSLVVERLAQAHKLASTARDSVTTAIGTTGSFTVNGKAVTVDASDSLTSIAQKINQADAGVTASLINGGAGQSYLTLTAKETGAAKAISLVDTGGAALGELGLRTELVRAQDAAYRLDGISFTSATNTLTNIIPGATVTLNKRNDGVTDPPVNLSLSRDGGSLKSQLKSFKEAYNGLVGFIRENSQFDTETFRSGPLFGDSSANQVESTLNNMLFSRVGSGSINNLTQLGFGLDEEGMLELDEGAFDRVLRESPEAVRSVLMSSGNSSAPGLSYVTSSVKSVASGPGGYAVNISQLATKGLALGSLAQTGPNVGGENLTFSGALFGANSVVIAVTPGSTAAGLVSQINADSRLKDLVTASLNVDGKLQLESKRFGTAGSFSMVSSMAAAADNSGVGTTAIAGNGLDIAGTINGELANGQGQFLLGRSGNARTDGLQIMYSGATTGFVGNLEFTSGLSALLSREAQSFTDSVNGLFTANDRAIADQISDIDRQISRLNDSITVKEQMLRQKFARMEEAISRSQSQGAQLSRVTGGASQAK